MVLVLTDRWGLANGEQTPVRVLQVSQLLRLQRGKSSTKSAQSQHTLGFSRFS